MARLQDKTKAMVVTSARQVDMTEGREAALDYLAQHGMGGHPSNDYAAAHRILDYETFRYINCVPKEQPLWREWRNEEDAAIRRRAEARKAKPMLLERKGGKCEWCGKTVTGSDATVDHIDPTAGNDIGNLALLCRSCNSRKNRKSLDAFADADKRHAAYTQRREAEAREDGFSSYAASLRFFECPCTRYGCPPDCMGCEMCGHIDTPPLPERVRDYMALNY